MCAFTAAIFSARKHNHSKHQNLPRRFVPSVAESTFVYSAQRTVAKSTLSYAIVLAKHRPQKPPHTNTRRSLIQAGEKE
jgi:hypothetical protein